MTFNNRSQVHELVMLTVYLIVVSHAEQVTASTLEQSQKKPHPIMDKLIEKHPLQRLNSPSRTASAALHIIGLASFGRSFKYLSDNPNDINSAYGWHFQYLTIIGLSLATLTFLSGLLADLTSSRRLFLIKNTLSVCSAPMAVVISILYWGLRLVDPTLVVPPEFELPLSADLGFHAAPSVLLLVDLLFFSPPWTIGAVPALALSTGIACAYWYWLEVCYDKNGFYPYPLFELLGVKERAGFFAGSAVTMAASTVVLKWIYGRINGSERVGKVKGR